MEAKVVIGANYGDEGKGLMTDYFAQQSIAAGEKTCVVLSNGGAQRGHTVTTPEGYRHVFKHFGSGSFVGADTYLAEKYIVNPIIFCTEMDELDAMGVRPAVYVNPNCIVTTIYDMQINQGVETDRGEDRFSSCGCGIFETVYRNRSAVYRNRSVYGITWGDLIEKPLPEIRAFLQKLRTEYIPARFQMYARKVPESLQTYLNDNAKELDELSMWAIFTMYQNTGLSETSHLLRYDSLIFENGQGLKLDEQYSTDRRYCTPSHTGLRNPAEIICELNEKRDTPIETEVCYVTRRYETRHGKGPMYQECSMASLDVTEPDETNFPNPWQGSLRYGKLDPNLGKLIDRDFDMYNPGGFKKSAAVTHVKPEDRKTVTVNGVDTYYISAGKTRANITERKGSV